MPVPAAQEGTVRVAPSVAQSGPEVIVSGPAALRAALANMQDGGVVTLKPGDYGTLRLGPGSGAGPAFAGPLTLRSADPAHPARLSGLKLRAAENVTLRGILFDYRFDPGDLPYVAPFSITGGRNIAITDSRFSGDNAHGIEPSENGYGYGNGLMVRGVKGFTLSNSRMERFRTGLTVVNSEAVNIRGNDISDMRSDGMDFIAVNGLIVADNRIHDFRGMPNWRDHRDMIQFWTTGTTRPSRDIVIRDNVLDIGRGSFTQSIFMRNEVVDQGKAGKAMFYRDVRIEGNTIYNNHRHGISVGQTDGLVIARNSLIEVPDMSPTGAAVRTVSGLGRPMINVVPDARHVAIRANATGGINGHSGQADWTVAGNAIIQPFAANLPGYYGNEFVTSSLDNSDGRHDYLVRSGGLMATLGAGAPSMLHPPAQAHPVARFDAIRVLGDLRARLFDGRISRLHDNEPPGPACRYLWSFGDGADASGALVRHRYARSGRYFVTLTVQPAQGAPAVVGAWIDIPPSDVLHFDPARGRLLIRRGARMVPYPLKPANLVDQPGGTGRALALGAGRPPVRLDAEAMGPVYGARALELNLSFRTGRPLKRSAEILRIGDALVISALPAGAVQLWLRSTGGPPLVLRSGGHRTQPGTLHHLTVAFDGMRRRATMRLDTGPALGGRAGPRFDGKADAGLSIAAAGGGQEGFAGEIETLSLKVAVDGV